jgi:SNW domain-containing protein 1
VSEKIALGMHRGSGQLSGEAVFDSRLFNQSSGLDTGFGAEDEYSTYTKPLFDRSEAASVYRPKRDDSEMYGDAETQLAKLRDTSRFKPDKGFKGAEGGTGAGGRDAPVQFERARDDDEVDDTVQTKRQRRDSHDD